MKLRTSTNMPKSTPNPGILDLVCQYLGNTAPFGGYSDRILYYVPSAADADTADLANSRADLHSICKQIRQRERMSRSEPIPYYMIWEQANIAGTRRRYLAACCVDVAGKNVHYDCGTLWYLSERFRLAVRTWNNVDIECLRMELLAQSPIGAAGLIQYTSDGDRFLAQPGAPLCRTYDLGFKPSLSERYPGALEDVLNEMLVRARLNNSYELTSMIEDIL